jgi:hypothetical protein
MVGVIVNCFANLNTSGVAVNGLAGKTINWFVLTTYNRVN